MICILCLLCFSNIFNIILYKIIINNIIMVVIKELIIILKCLVGYSLYIESSIVRFQDNASVNPKAPVINEL